MGSLLGRESLLRNRLSTWRNYRASSPGHQVATVPIYTTPVLELTHTDLHMTELSGGSVTDHGTFLAVRTPDNPGYYHGNYLFLRFLPRDLEAWVKTADEVIGASHICLRWDGPGLSDAEMAAAARAGFGSDDGIAMELTAVGSVKSRADLVVRPLVFPAEWDAVVALDVACEPSEEDSAEYQLFKDRIRAARQRWLSNHAATWWGAFAGDQLVGGCGLVPCGDVGRFQVVETHPEYRRQGVCTTLIATLARAGLKKHRALLLCAEPDGPALELYRRLGFVEVGWQRTLIRSGADLRVRPEVTGDHAGIYTLIAAAFGQPGEADLVARLRDLPGVISLVAERTGKLLGHAFFTPVRVESPRGTWDAVALGPVAARPGYQRRGVGSALIEAGLLACEEAGHRACFVLGDPVYYARFGFEPAQKYHLRPTWSVPAEAFMVVALKPGALEGHSGLVRYHADFDKV